MLFAVDIDRPPPRPRREGAADDRCAPQWGTGQAGQREPGPASAAPCIRPPSRARCIPARSGWATSSRWSATAFASVSGAARPRSASAAVGAGGGGRGANGSCPLRAGRRPSPRPSRCQDGTAGAMCQGAVVELALCAEGGCALVGLLLRWERGRSADQRPASVHPAWS